MPKGTSVVSLSAFSFLMESFVTAQMEKKQVKGKLKLSEKLFDLGYGVGMRMMELISIRDKDNNRSITQEKVMSFIGADMWRTLFGYEVPISRVKDKPNECL